MSARREVDADGQLLVARRHIDLARSSSALCRR
ncbi:putative leader peptide [Frankia nepalensis]|nr:putative leader peptide [Frankia nepalensis]